MKNILKSLLITAAMVLPYSAFAAPDVDDITMEVMENHNEQATEAMDKIELPEHEGQEGIEEHSADHENDSDKADSQETVEVEVEDHEIEAPEIEHPEVEDHHEVEQPEDHPEDHPDEDKAEHQSDS